MKPAPLRKLESASSIARPMCALGAGMTERPQWVEGKKKNFSELVDEHRRGLFEMLNQFREASTPYPSRPFVEFASRYGEYDHLARVKEWSRDGAESDE